MICGAATPDLSRGRARARGLAPVTAWQPGEAVFGFEGVKGARPRLRDDRDVAIVEVDRLVQPPPQSGRVPGQDVLIGNMLLLDLRDPPLGTCIRSAAYCWGIPRALRISASCCPSTSPSRTTNSPPADARPDTTGRPKPPTPPNRSSFCPAPNTGRQLMTIRQVLQQ